MTQWHILAFDHKDDAVILLFGRVPKEYKREGILCSISFDYKISETSHNILQVRPKCHK